MIEERFEERLKENSLTYRKMTEERYTKDKIEPLSNEYWIDDLGGNMKAMSIGFSYTRDESISTDVFFLYRNKKSSYMLGVKDLILKRGNRLSFTYEGKKIVLDFTQSTDSRKVDGTDSRKVDKADSRKDRTNSKSEATV